MDKKELSKWIVDWLSGYTHQHLPTKPHDFRGEWATPWNPIIGPDQNEYDVCIIYVVSDHDTAKFYATRSDLAACVYLPQYKNGSSKPDQVKFDQLLDEINKNFQKGGNYKLEKDGDTFKIIAI
jgi:hypothetical protein